MPYQRTREVLTRVLSIVLARPEIAEELERLGLRRPLIEQEVLEQSQQIWESMSSRVEAYDLTEQALATEKARHASPAAPKSVAFLKNTSWAVFGVTGALLAAALIAILSKNWKTTDYFLQHFATRRVWVFIIANLIVLASATQIWYRRQARSFASLKMESNEALKTRLKPLDNELQAARKLADESLLQALTSQVLATLSSKLSHRYGIELPSADTDGLSQVQNPEFEIVTVAGKRLNRIITAVNGASIGISGSRGAGKTTLLLSQFQIGNTKPNVLSVFTSAPVEYDAREFVLHLFASVCSRVLEKAIGRQDTLDKQTSLRERERDEELERYRMCRSRTVLSRLLQPSGRPYLLVGVGLIYGSMALAFLKVESSRRSVLSGSNAAHVPLLNALLDALGLNPGIIFGCGVAVMALWAIGGPYLRAFQERNERSKEASRPDRIDREYEDELRRKGPHVLAAFHHLSSIRFQQSFTSGWSGSLKLPIALEGTMKSDRSWMERPRSLPDIVDDYRHFLDQIVGSENNPYDQVLICIDELDKLASDEVAQRFLNGIKSIFNQKKCYYLVSVSENAMSSFERRGLPVRDAFDSSFDEVIYVDYQPLSASKRLLSRRVLNLPDPYVCLAHVLSGGLPRDLLRVCRAMFDARALGVANTISEICRHVVSNDLETKLRAIAFAAEQSERVPGAFAADLSKSTAPTASGMWELIAMLRSYQGMPVASKDKHEVDDSDGSALPKLSLPTETLILVFFLVTVLEIFESLDETSWRKAEDTGLFEQLAALRRSLSKDAGMIAAAIDGIRSAFLLPVAEVRLYASAKP